MSKVIFHFIDGHTLQLDDHKGSHDFVKSLNFVGPVFIENDSGATTVVNMQHVLFVTEEQV